MSPDRNAEKGELLVVDDNRVNRLLVARTLEQFGHRVAFATAHRSVQTRHQLCRQQVELLRPHG